MSFTLRRRQAPPDLMRCSFRRAEGVLMTRQGEELVLLDTRAERYYTLNDVGAVAWSALTQPSTCATIVGAIQREFDVSTAPDKAVVERDVARLMEQLVAAGLVTAVASASAGTAT
jgi:hypothetical protein